MFFFNRKPKTTIMKLAKSLAPVFAEYTIATFDDENNFWLHENSGLEGKPELFQEWLLYRLFCDFNGYKASMKSHDAYIEFSQIFLKTCGDMFMAKAIFSSIAEYEQLGKSRFSDYVDALNDRDGTEAIQNVGRRFLVNTRCSPDNYSQLLGASAIFSIYSIAAKETLDKLQSEYRLVE